MSAEIAGRLFGSLVITGLISRILDKYAFKALKTGTKALIVALLTIAISLGLASFTMGLQVAALYYIPTTAFWFVYDLFRARKPSSSTSRGATPTKQTLGTKRSRDALAGGAAPSPKVSDRPWRLLNYAVSLAVAAGAYYGVRALTSRYSTESSLAAAMQQTPYDRSLIRSLKAGGAYRQYAAFISAQTDSSSAFTAMATATRRGITLLGQEDQAGRIEVLDQQFAKMAPRDCAAIQRGSPDAGRAFGAMTASMDSVSMDIFTGILARAFQASEQNPGYRVPPVDQNEAIDLFRRVGASLPEPDRTRYFAVWGNFNAASDTDVCWATLTVSRVALSQDAEARRSAVRLLTLLGAQEPSPIGRR